MVAKKIYFFIALSYRKYIILYDYMHQTYSYVDTALMFLAYAYLWTFIIESYSETG